MGLVADVGRHLRPFRVDLDASRSIFQSPVGVRYPVAVRVEAIAFM